VSTRQPPADPQDPADRPPRRPARRPLQVLVIALLILVPTGYGAVAAVQSRDSDGDKQLQAEKAGLIHQWPSRMQCSLYKVPVPYNATHVGYFESNAWSSSSLYVQFTTTGGGLDTFLAQLGTSRTELTSGRVTVTSAQSTRVGWHFGSGHHWSGTVLSKPGSAPDHRITVDLDNPDEPSVYVVSTTDFG
jgi:predicted RNA-binding protein with PIN domain